MTQQCLPLHGACQTAHLSPILPRSSSGWALISWWPVYPRPCTSRMPSSMITASSEVARGRSVPAAKS